ncbi:MAG: folate family ECF transporter S component [Clostridia bacterium]|nr:folate family ECF transporter S component [Clostridia bacterium]
MAEDNTRASGVSTARKAVRIILRICICAMLIAMEIVLNRFLSINTMGLKIGFAFLPPMLAAMLYGPGTSALIWAASDFLGALLFPIGPYHPGFTVCAAFMGLVMGVMVHQNPIHVQIGRGNLHFIANIHWDKIKFYNILIPVLINCLVIGLLVNTFWVSQLYGSKTYWGWFLYRLPEYAVMIPVQIVFAPVLMRIVKILRKLRLTN